MENQQKDGGPANGSRPQDERAGCPWCGEVDECRGDCPERFKTEDEWRQAMQLAVEGLRLATFGGVRR